MENGLMALNMAKGSLNSIMVNHMMANGKTMKDVVKDVMFG